MSSVFHKNHTPPDAMDGRELLQETMIQSEIRKWNLANPGAQTVNDQFQDLILYETGLKQLMSRVPMMLRLGSDTESPLPQKELKALRAAIEHWKPVEHFYKTTIPVLEQTIRQNNQFFNKTPEEQHKGGTLALLHYKRQIAQTTRHLTSLVSALYEAGFTPNALYTPRHSSWLRKSA
jgi:hypothetical protein